MPPQTAGHSHARAHQRARTRVGSRPRTHLQPAGPPGFSDRGHWRNPPEPTGLHIIACPTTRSQLCVRNSVGSDLQYSCKIPQEASIERKGLRLEDLLVLITARRAVVWPGGSAGSLVSPIPDCLWSSF